MKQPDVNQAFDAVRYEDTRRLAHLTSRRAPTPPAPPPRVDHAAWRDRLDAGVPLQDVSARLIGYCG